VFTGDTAVAQSVYKLGYRIDNSDLIRGRCNIGVFSLLSFRHRFQNSSGDHQNSYPMSIVGPYPSGKAAGE
jgi:hypothetical protein